MKNFKWDKKYLYWGATAFSVILCSIAFFWILNKWSGVSRILGLIMSALSPFICGILIAYLLNKVMVIFEHYVFKKLTAKLFPKKPVTAGKAARLFSILLTMLLALGVIVGLLVIILPQIYHSVVELITKSSGYLEIAANWVEQFLNGDILEPIAMKWLNTASEHLVNWLETDVLPQISTLVTSITGGVISIVGAVFNFLVGLIISIYIMYNKETFCAQAKKILFAVCGPRTANRVIDEMGFINDAFGDYIVGTVIDSLIVGVVNYIFMMIVGIPFAALVSILVGITNLIPIFGPFIGAIPSALLILLENPMMCLIFVIFTLVLQQIDGHIIKPKIHSSKSGISGFWIMFAILFFGGLFGIWGMILGVPVTTVLYNIIKRLNNRRLRSRGLPEDTGFYKAIDHIDPGSGEPVYKPGYKPAPPEERETGEPPDEGGAGVTAAADAKDVKNEDFGD